MPATLTADLKVLLAEAQAHKGIGQYIHIRERAPKIVGAPKVKVTVLVDNTFTYLTLSTQQEYPTLDTWEHVIDHWPGGRPPYREPRRTRRYVLAAHWPNREMP